MKKYIKHIIFVVMAVIITAVSILKVSEVSQEAISFMPITNKTIVLDAGHGGIDSGTSSDDKTIFEKDINLAITLKLKELIESSGALVILTRDDDSSLYEESENKTTRQKYNENLKNRKKIVDESNADMFISIHLNYFTQSKYYGAQTFYPEGDVDGKALANCIQDELKRVVDNDNDRVIKPRNDLYLLKDCKIPSALIECGFLSNYEEEHRLREPQYQKQICCVIASVCSRFYQNNYEI